MTTYQTTAFVQPASCSSNINDFFFFFYGKLLIWVINTKQKLQVSQRWNFSDMCLFWIYCTLSTIYLRKLFKSLKELASSKIVVIQHFIIFKPCRTYQLLITPKYQFIFLHSVTQCKACFKLHNLCYFILLFFRGLQRSFSCDQKCLH